MDDVEPVCDKGLDWRKGLAIGLGPVLGLIPLFIPAPGGLSPEAWRLVGLTLWMVVWWLSEAVPIPATALLPIPLMPLLGIADEKSITSHYANPLIFLFLGGFMIALAMQKWGLHTRIALTIVRAVGTSPAGLIGGMVCATGFISMWVNNTSTTIMMYPVGLSLLQYLKGVSPEDPRLRNFSVAMMLAIAYSASIGGVGTLIGTAPNALLAGFLQESYKQTITMSQWLWVGLPFVFIMLPVMWFLLTQVIYPVRGLRFEGAQQLIRKELSSLGRMSVPERVVLGVFLLAVLGWLVREPLSKATGLPLSDSFIAMSAALLLFVLPVSLARREFAIDWSTAEKLPWGVLLLFGGGLAIAGAFESTGLAKWIGGQVSGLSVDLWVLILVVSTLIIFLTELTSNTAVTATFLPVMGAVAVGLGHDPRWLVIPVAMSASAAFMLPVATPPNAIVFANPDLHVRDMARAGFLLNLFAIMWVTLIMLLFAKRGLGLP
jgi:sodium-dependent dicarboxylate transporter 2/3/5